MTEDQGSEYMNPPFIIWTMRRTGGTSLSNILSCLTNENVEHEPFNWDRSFGHISKAFQNEHKNLAMMAQSLEECCLSQRVNVKHCYEILGQVFNEALIELLAKSCYKHIILTRKNELLRLLSLYTAKHTNVWGKHGSEEVYEKYKSGIAQLPSYDIADMKNHARHCRKMTNRVRKKLTNLGVDVYEIFYEDLFTNTKSLEHRQVILTQLCQHLSIDVNLIKQKEQDYQHLLMKTKQNDLFFYNLIPNLTEIQAAFPKYSLSEVESSKN